jgi:hypothetical protein
MSNQKILKIGLSLNSKIPILELKLMSPKKNLKSSKTNIITMTISFPDSKISSQEPKPLKKIFKSLSLTKTLKKKNNLYEKK